VAAIRHDRWSSDADNAPPRELPGSEALEVLGGVDEHAQQIARFRTYLFVLIALAVAFATTEAAGAVAFRSESLALVATITTSVLIACLVALSLLRRGRLTAAVSLIAYAQLGVGAGCAIGVRFLTPTLVLLPIVSVALSLPFLTGRPLRRLMLVAFVSWMFTASFGVLMPDRSDVSYPWKAGLVIASSAALSVLSLTILLQFSERIRTALDHATRALRLREEFITVAAHELRTPLTALKLQLTRVARIANSAPEGQQLSPGLGTALRQAGRLEALVEGLLDISRWSGNLNLIRESVDLGTLVREVAERFAESLRRAGCQLHIETRASPIGQWDALRLEQVVTTLLENAIKFGAGKPIEIRIDDRPGIAVLAILDHGIGVPPEDADRIFERFERAVPSTSYGGLGLGLYVARTIVQAHRGSISVDSRPGETTFTVELPLGESSVASA
jgi:signal transduction histidine kinase